MTATLIDSAPTPAPVGTPAQRLRYSTAAVRVSIQWLGVRKTLSREQKSQAAETFDAESDFLSARKKLLDTKHTAYKAVTAVRGKVIAFWKSLTLPFPEPGLRLIKQSQIEPFDQQMREFRADLRDAVSKLEEHYEELQEAARERLGTLFDASDYPASLEGLFAIDWDYPNVEPPSYLMQLNPSLYEAERARVASRFDEAVALAEQGFVAELAKLVSHLTERLSGTTDGEKRVFRDSAISNLTEFFERFKSLNIRSNDQLDNLVEQAQHIVQGVEAQTLRDSAALRQHVATQMAGVTAALDGMMIDRPRRTIIRSRPLGGNS
jgi:hypothetical protein